MFAAILGPLDKWIRSLLAVSPAAGEVRMDPHPIWKLISIRRRIKLGINWLGQISEKLWEIIFAAIVNFYFSTSQTSGSELTNLKPRQNCSYLCDGWRPTTQYKIGFCSQSTMNNFSLPHAHNQSSPRRNCFSTNFLPGWCKGVF